MDATEPPRVVIEGIAACPDALAADQLVRDAIAHTPAHDGAWMVEMRVEQVAAARTRLAAGRIVDAGGRAVAHRTFTSDSRDCAGLARAVGIWAALVLDAETSTETSAKVPVVAPRPVDSPEVVATWPAPAETLPADDTKTALELGGSTFVMAGVSPGVVAGPALHSLIATGRGIFLRPMIALGRQVQPSVPGQDAYGLWGAARVEACARFAGVYAVRRGLQLAPCFGADFGFWHTDALHDATSHLPAQTRPFAALGPSLGIRGEIGGDIALELRAVAEVNIVRATYVAPAVGEVGASAFAGRGELALSWGIR
jgi:hypothetical protein